MATEIIAKTGKGNFLMRVIDQRAKKAAEEALANAGLAKTDDIPKLYEHNVVGELYSYIDPTTNADITLSLCVTRYRLSFDGNLITLDDLFPYGLNDVASFACGGHAYVDGKFATIRGVGRPDETHISIGVCDHEGNGKAYRIPISEIYLFDEVRIV